jgi:hypothetical protein
MLGLEKLLQSEPTTGDRRRGRRFDLKLKCRASRLFSKSRSLAGVTENFSRSGILVRFANAQAVEFFANRQEPVKIVVELPQSPSFPGRCLECMGNVARIAEVGTDAPYVAFEIGRIQVKDTSTANLRSMSVLGRPQ